MVCDECNWWWGCKKMSNVEIDIVQAYPTILSKNTNSEERAALSSIYPKERNKKNELYTHLINFSYCQRLSDTNLEESCTTLWNWCSGIEGCHNPVAYGKEKMKNIREDLKENLKSVDLKGEAIVFADQVRITELSDYEIVSSQL